MHCNYALPLCIWDACTRTSSSSLPMIDGLLIDSINRWHGLSMYYNYAVVCLYTYIWDACTRTSSSSLPMIDGLLIDSIDRWHGLSMHYNYAVVCLYTYIWDACTRTSSSSLPNTHTHTFTYPPALTQCNYACTQIVGVGPDVPPEYAVGRRVCVENHFYCGHCYQCTHGTPLPLLSSDC